MGASGPALFSDDVAADVRGVYRELLEDGVDDNEAIERVLGQFSDALTDRDDGPVVIFALAVTASKLGRLGPALRARALALLDAGRGVEQWEEEAPKLLRQRQESLRKVRDQLTGPQPRRKPVRPPSRHVTTLQPGDLLALELREGDYTALRVLRVQESRYGLDPLVQILDWRGANMPVVPDVANVPDLAPRPIVDGERNGWWSTSSWLIGRRGHDYSDVGFVKIGTTETRPGDKDAQSNHYPSWDVLAKFMQTWAANESSA